MKKLLIVAVILVLIVFGAFYAKDKAVEFISENMLDSQITKYAEKAGYSKEQIQKVLDNVSESDEKLIKDIINKHANITEVISIVSSDDAKKEIESKLSQDELNTIKDLYIKYKNKIK